MAASKVTGKSGPAKGSKYNKQPPMLTDMRWAYRHLEDGKVGTAAQEQFRQMYREKPAAFIEMLDRLERQYKPPRKSQPPNPVGNPAFRQAAQAKAEATGSTQAAPDVGESKCVELVERLLGESPWRTGAEPPQP